MTLKWSKEEIDILKKQYGNIPTKNIALNRTYCAIKAMASVLKLKTSSINYNKYSLNHNFFSQVHILNAYYAGLLAADGCLVDYNHRYTVILGMNDEHIIEQFKKDIEYNGVTKIVHYSTKKTNYRIEISSDIIFKDLINIWNITPRKSLTLQPPNLTGDLAMAYILGYFDGDGCASILRHKYLYISFCSASKDLIDWIISILGVNNKITIKRGANPTYYLSIGGQNAYNIMQKLYSLGTPYLFRKKKIVDAIQSRYDKGN